VCSNFASLDVFLFWCQLAQVGQKEFRHNMWDRTSKEELQVGNICPRYSSTQCMQDNKDHLVSNAVFQFFSFLQFSLWVLRELKKKWNTTELKQSSFVFYWCLRGQKTNIVWQFINLQIVLRFSQITTFWAPQLESFCYFKLARRKHMQVLFPVEAMSVGFYVIFIPKFYNTKLICVHGPLLV